MDDAQIGFSLMLAAIFGQAVVYGLKISRDNSNNPIHHLDHLTPSVPAALFLYFLGTLMSTPAVMGMNSHPSYPVYACMVVIFGLLATTILACTWSIIFTVLNGCVKCYHKTLPE